MLKDGMRPPSTGHWVVSSVNACVFEPGDADRCVSLPMGSFSRDEAQNASLQRLTVVFHGMPNSFCSVAFHSYTFS